jgi:hypothetical protein
MPFLLPKGAAREYLTANDIVAIYVVEIPEEAVMVGVSRDLYQTLIAVRRHHKYAAIVAAYWLKGEADAQLICDAALDGEASKVTPAMMANRIEAAAESLNIAVTDHQTILLKVRAAVQYVEERLAEAQEAGQLRFFNRAYRQWRLEAKAHGRSMTYAEARARLRYSLYRQIAQGEAIDIGFPAIERLTA